MQKHIRIAYTGGGTGGHIYPLLAVADEITKGMRRYPDVRVSYSYFGDPGMYSDEFVKRKITIRHIMGSKLRRYASFLNILDAIKFPFSFLQALLKLLFIMPDVLFSKGGTGALPVILAAWIYRIPIIVHESDAVPGLTNRLSFPFASRVGVAFERALTFVKGNKGALVGNPVRPFLLTPSDVTQEQAKRIFGFDPQVPLILVMGGSQGSQRLNTFLLDTATELVPHYQVLHQTGMKNFSDVSRELNLIFKNQIHPYQERYKVVDFFRDNLKDAFIAADIIVSRSGSFLFEIATFAKPSIVIPLKESANNHQWYDALEYSQKGACIIIEEDNLTPVLFLTQLKKISTDVSSYHHMSTAAHAFATPDAALVLAQEIIRLGWGSKV
ncbi:MAG: UDP-N-acetylglucosamine--N-acetylmuramyl-(pentapeptide) pyrophosphoryl-undecaprenol N-acetylglucosamine transferase [Candidatus Paceibacterota bacterium]